MGEPRVRLAKTMKGDKEDVDSSTDRASCVKVRYVQGVLLFFVLLLAWSMRVNINMAIIEMTNSDYENSFDWSTQKKSVILSSFTWGYIVLQVPGGMLAARVGAKWLLFTIMLVNGVMCALTPVAAYYGGANMVIACRVIQGLAQGSLYPSLHSLVAKWVPKEEKGRLGTLIYAGANLGMALQYLAAGLLAGFFGWAAIFYVNAVLVFIWCIVYAFYGSNSPYEHKSISEGERDYIQNSLKQTGPPKKYSTPWKYLLTSTAFISIVIANIGHNWGLQTLATYLPSYMNLFQGVDIKTNGVVSAIPYLIKYMCSFPFGFISDYVLRKGWATVTTTRKICNTIAFWGPAAALVGLSFAPARNVILGVGLYSIVTGLNAGNMAGFILVHIDMAPNFAGVMIGITNGLASFISIFAPLVVGVFLEDESSIGDWRKVFCLLALIYFLTNLIYLIFGTSERQEWNEPEDSTKKKKQEENKV